MADGWCVNTKDSPHTRLRNANNSLLKSLRQGQKEVWSVLQDMQARKPAFSSGLSQGMNPETSFTVRGYLDRTPTSVQRSERRTDYSSTATSTPKSYRDALTESGNDRRNRNVSSTELTPNSILRHSTNNARKTPKKELHVSFQSLVDENRNVIDDNLNRRSMLGYDWIAGILDNTSYLAEKNDDFFDDLKEFRRVNREECCSKTLSEPILKPYRSITPLKKDEGLEDKESYSCENTYRLNDRLFAERIHSTDVSCGVCYTKPQPEYETQGSYVRVSVPRSTLMSPYKIKPHRRASFDPTDSIGLSSHCLAGWESSKPAVAPSQTSLDLKASLHKTRETLDASRAGRYPPDHQSTRDLLDRSHSLRYGLQVLDMERGLSDKAHTTPFPAF